MPSNQRQDILVLMETSNILNNTFKVVRRKEILERAESITGAGTLVRASLCRIRQSLLKVITKGSRIQWQLPTKEEIAARPCLEAAAMNSVVPIKIAIILAEILIKTYHRTRRRTFWRDKKLLRMITKTSTKLVIKIKKDKMVDMVWRPQGRLVWIKRIKIAPIMVRYMRVPIHKANAQKVNRSFPAAYHQLYQMN